MNRHCVTCIDLGNLTSVAIYSLTLCAEHFEDSYQKVLREATPEEWAAAWLRAS